MRTFTISTWYLALLLVTACGDNSRAPLPDAPPAEMPGSPLERLDWRTTRGVPIATSAVTIPAAEMFAVSRDGFVTQSECQNFPTSPVCTFTWHDLAGTPGMRRDNMTSVTSTVVSPDGRRALLVALEAMEICTNSLGAFQVARGALQLLDVATG